MPTPRRVRLALSRRPRLLRWERPAKNSTSMIIVAALVVTLGGGATALAATWSDDGSSSPAATSDTAALSAASQGRTPATAAPRPSTMPNEPSSRPQHLVDGTLLVSDKHPLSGHQAAALRHLSGVRQTQWVAAGPTKIDGHRAFVVGVRPATFRPWTPKLTARSNALWQSIGRGELTASFDMGHNAKLPLGQTVPVHAHTTRLVRIGAFASVGMAGVDGVVDAYQGRQIGLVRHSGMLISAPQADPLQLRREVESILGSHARAELLRQVVIARNAGEFLSNSQISAFLAAASSRLGKPYVWGATGPDAFDCSGLVQWSLAHAGIRMPRVSQEQYLTGPHLPYADARPGDLLFWHYDPTDVSDIDHVAIYAGKGMMLVAPHTGENVQYVPVPLNEFAGVVRIDPAVASQIA
jgi:cell wall-associated NlpC family hydrolase